MPQHHWLLLMNAIPTSVFTLCKGRRARASLASLCVCALAAQCPPPADLSVINQSDAGRALWRGTKAFVSVSGNRRRVQFLPPPSSPNSILVKNFCIAANRWSEMIFRSGTSVSPSPCGPAAHSLFNEGIPKIVVKHKRVQLKKYKLKIVLSSFFLNNILNPETSDAVRFLTWKEDFVLSLGCITHSH